MSEPLEVTNVKTIVKSLRIPIDHFVDNITFVYQKPGPIGFDFECSNTRELIAMLSLNLNFGVDDTSQALGHLATRLSTGLSFRQVDSTSSIHFEVSLLTVNVHLDTVSVVLGRDEHGRIIYDTGEVLQHLVNDHWNNHHLIVPNGKDGLVFGWRFW